MRGARGAGPGRAAEPAPARARGANPLPRRGRRLTAALLALPLLLLRAPGALAAPTHLAEPGDLPILLTAPHDGGESIAGLPERGNRGDRKDFLATRDLYTERLLRETAEAIRRRTGGRPYVVINRLARRYMDPNREPERGAWEHPLGERAWRDYHGAIARFRREIRRRFGSGVLADLHGHASRPADAYIGTRGGRTIARLVARAGRARALGGPESLAARLAAAGFALPGFAASITTDMPFGRRLSRPLVAPIPPRNPRTLDGGGTVALHGSHRPGGLDAYQVELHRRVRADARARRRFAAALARALLDPRINPGIRPPSRTPGSDSD